MPADDRFRPNKEEPASPVLMEAADDEPEELVPALEAGPALRTKSDLELLAEQKILEEEMTAAAKSPRESGEQELAEFEHPP
jgi:hypothetical protein